MLYESRHVVVSAIDGVATLSFAFPGAAVNPLSAARLADIEGGLDAVSRAGGIDAVVVRSDHPAGFCEGFDPAAFGELTTDADAAAFTATGQRVLGKLAAAAFVSVAYVHGPCLGPGLELALACDYRLAQTGPTGWVGLGERPTCWGGQARLTQLLGRRLAERFRRDRFTAREAAKLRVFDHAFCERRGKIELRGWLDRLTTGPAKPRSWWRDAGIALAGERVAFRAAVRTGLATPPTDSTLDTLNPVQPLRRVGLAGERLGGLAAEFALRGVAVVWVGGEAVPGAFDLPLARGRITPLESEQAAGRITLAADAEAVAAADFVYLDDSAATAAGHIERELLPRAVLAVPHTALLRVVQLASRPGRVIGLGFTEAATTVRRTDDTTPDTVAAVSSWLTAIGCPPTVRTMKVIPALVSVG